MDDFRDEYKLLTPMWLQYIESFLQSSWWVIAIVLICISSYLFTEPQFREEYAKLSQQFAHLKLEKQELEVEHQKLVLQINSQGDQAWIELTLMKTLGLVPEDYVKVFF